MYNRDLAGTRYSPLTQINTANVANVKLAWSYKLSNAPAGRGAAPAAAPATPGPAEQPAAQADAEFAGGGGAARLGSDRESGSNTHRHQ